MGFSVDMSLINLNKESNEVKAFVRGKYTLPKKVPNVGGWNLCRKTRVVSKDAVGSFELNRRTSDFGKAASHSKQLWPV